MLKRPCRLTLAVVICLTPALVVSWWAAGAVSAGQIEVNCQRPQIWESASINAVILPYTYAGSDKKRLSETAEELTRLIQMHVLFSILKFGRVGMTGLSIRGMNVKRIDQLCSPETVMAKLLGRQSGAKNEIPSGKGVIFLWGYLYEEGQDVYVQSYIRFLRRDVAERVILSVNAGGPKPARLTAGFPDQAIAFAPRKLTVAQIREISSTFRKSARLYERPNLNSGSRRLRPRAPLQFWIEDTQGGWMRLRGYAGAQSGWVQAQVSIDAMPIDRKLPELSFLEAVAGYLRFQLHEDGADPYPKPQRLIRWTRDYLARFESAVSSGQGSEARAAAIILNANLDLQSAGPDSLLPAAMAAEKKYAAAASMLPYSADIRNLAAITGIYIGGATGWSSRKPADYADTLIRSLALDPGHRDILANLETLLVSIRDLPAEKRQMPAADLNSKLAAVQRVQANLGAGQ